MINSDIESKLRAVIDSEVESLDEYRVVFLLAKLRIFLELNDLKKSYKYLKLYCDWVLHCRYHDTQFLADLGVFQDRELQEQEVLLTLHIQFFSELNRFTLLYFGKKYVDGSDNYNIFCRLLDEQIKDVPLIFTKNEKSQTRLIIENGNRYWRTEGVDN